MRENRTEESSLSRSSSSTTVHRTGRCGTRQLVGSGKIQVSYHLQNPITPRRLALWHLVQVLAASFLGCPLCAAGLALVHRDMLRRATPMRVGGGNHLPSILSASSISAAANRRNASGLPLMSPLEPGSQLLVSVAGSMTITLSLQTVMLSVSAISSVLRDFIVSSPRE